MKSASRPVFAALRKQYATQAAKKIEPLSTAKQQVEVSKLPNGTVLASFENYSPVSHIAVVYNAGSRYEHGTENVGITHCLRNVANLSTQKSSSFGVSRNLQQIGASLEVSSTKEHMIYSINCLRNVADVGLDYLAQVATVPAFKPWELADSAHHIDTELAMLSHQPHIELMEALHKAAYRKGLGNALYMPSYKIGNHTPDHLQAFVNKHYVPSNMAIVGVGMDHETLVHLVNQKFGFHRSDKATTAPSTDKSQYFGGEQRIENNNSIVHSAIVTEGLSLDSTDLLPLAVLQKLMGTGPSIKYSSNMNAKLVQAGTKTSSNPFHASAININYSDSGLFGFYLISHANETGKVLKSLVDEFSSVVKGNISVADINRAKSQLKSAILMEGEAGSSLVADMGVQALLSHDVIEPSVVAASVDNVTAEQVQAVGKKVMSKKPTMAAIGDLTDTPYLDELV